MKIKKREILSQNLPNVCTDDRQTSAEQRVSSSFGLPRSRNMCNAAPENINFTEHELGAVRLQQENCNVCHKNKCR
jgi:hypothetical protein